MSSFVLKVAATALGLAAVLGATGAFAQAKYTAEVRRTSFGIPHIKASDYGSLGYGVGYAYAQDNLCVIAEEMLNTRGERSRYFGATGSTVYGNNNLFNDVYYSHFNGDSAALLAGFNSQKDEVKAAFRGWIAGYNRYLRDTGVANVSGGCGGQPWVRALTDVDMAGYLRAVTLRASSGNFIDAIPFTKPPTAAAAKDWDGLFDENFWRDWQTRMESLGSNGLALGADATDNGRGLLLGNPHFPWIGPLRFYQLHVTMGSDMNAMGGTLPGLPFVGIGFTQDAAWSYTVDKVNHFAFYKLTLDPSSPFKYIFDGKVRDITQKAITVQVRLADGSVVPVTRTIYLSHLGPVVNAGAPLVWTNTNAYVIVDANLDNWRAGNHLFDMSHATSTLDIEATLERNLGLPWFNTIATDKTGDAFYADITPTWNIDRFLGSLCTPDITAAVVFSSIGVPVLDGSRSSCLAPVDPSAPQPGLLPGARMPRVHRRDFVQNSNDNYWLTNPAVDFYSWYFPALVGIVPQQANLRTRLGVSQALARLAGSDGLPGNKFTLANLQQIALSNRSYAADVFLPDMLTLCDTTAAASVSSLCAVLKAWDRKFELGSRGAHLFKEFWTTASAIPSVYAVPFDYTNPYTTPRGLNISNATVATALVNALAAAGAKITNAGLSVDGPLGAQQFAIQILLSGGKTIIPMFGGGGDIMGTYSKIDTTLQPGVGYIVTSGTSYIQTVQFTDSGVNAQAMLSYSQSANPASPNFADQTVRFAAKQWITLPFTESAITGDPNYKTSTISE